MKHTKNNPDLTFNFGEVKVWFSVQDNGRVLTEIEYDNDKRIKFSTFLWLDCGDKTASALRKLTDHLDKRNSDG